jgi:trehalose synthase
LNSAAPSMTTLAQVDGLGLRGLRATGFLGQDREMAEPRDIEVSAIAPQRLSYLIGSSRLNRLVHAADQTRAALGGGRVWNLSATSAGGGVSEMLHTLVGYSLGCGVDTRWVVIDGDEAFFKITKRLDNRLHGAAGDTGGLGRSEADHYAAVMDENAAALINRINEGDVVVLHDPQTVGLAEAVTKRGLGLFGGATSEQNESMPTPKRAGTSYKGI